jgi:hypothetical protein
MPFVAGLILLAVSGGGIEVVNEAYQIPAADWRYVDLGHIRRPVIVKAFFRVESGPSVRLMVLTRADLDHMSHGEPYTPLRALESQGGMFAQRIIQPGGEYAVAVENHGSQPASVHLQILLDYGDATQLSPERRLTVIAISFAVFFGLVSFSATKLWRAANPRV